MGVRSKRKRGREGNGRNVERKGKKQVEKDGGSGRGEAAVTKEEEKEGRQTGRDARKGEVERGTRKSGIRRGNEGKGKKGV